MAVKAMVLIIFLSILFGCVSATNHTVGGTTSWDLASDMPTWSSARTFFTGDNLVFSYGPTHDVLEVNGSEFANCKTTSPISTYNDGDTVVPLTSPGIRYFICGTRGHCGLGLRVQVDVLPLTANATSSGSGNGQEQGNGRNHRHHPHSPPPSPPPPPPPPPPSPHTGEGDSQSKGSPCSHQGSATRRVEMGMVGGLVYYSLHLITALLIFSS